MNFFMQIGKGSSGLKQQGFTMIELVLVTAILGVLALLAVPAFSGLKYKAKITQAAAEIRGLDKDINAFLTDRNTLPDSLNDPLFSQVVGRGNLADPWGNQYQYYNVAKLGGAGAYEGLVLLEDGTFAVNTDYDLYSLGRDGITGKSLNPPIPDASKDDILRASDGSYVGLGEGF